MRLVLLGDPVAHSRSPAIQNAALEAAGIAGAYEARRVDAAGMVAAVDEIRYGRLDGANVTMPHKHQAFELSDRVSGSALRSGAVNTLAGDDGSVWGHNTDIDGIRAVWRSAGLPTHAPVLVLGTGGAAAGAIVALDGHAIMVSGRKAESAADVLHRVRSDGEVVPWGSGVDGSVVVNATPLGMAGETLPERVLAGSIGLFDLTYGPAPTPAVERSKDAGLPTADGRELLLAQAAASFEIWTGTAAPTKAMRAAF